MTKVVVRRFIKGVIAAAVAAAIAYAIDHAVELEGVLHPTVMALLTGILLAVQKWLKEYGSQ